MVLYTIMPMRFGDAFFQRWWRQAFVLAVVALIVLPACPTAAETTEDLDPPQTVPSEDTEEVAPAVPPTPDAIVSHEVKPCPSSTEDEDAEAATDMGEEPSGAGEETPGNDREALLKKLRQIVTNGKLISLDPKLAVFQPLTKDETTEDPPALFEDAIITSAIRKKIGAEESLQSLELSVTAKSGVVTVGGPFRQSEQVATIAKLALDVDGIRELQLVLPENLPETPEPSECDPDETPASGEETSSEAATQDPAPGPPAAEDDEE